MKRDAKKQAAFADFWLKCKKNGEKPLKKSEFIYLLRYHIKINIEAHHVPPDCENEVDYQKKRIPFSLTRISEYLN